MTERRRLMVTASDVGVIIETAPEEAAIQIAAAREFLRGLGSDFVLSRPPRVRQAGKTLAERILGFGPDYFAQPKESLNICKELARAAHHYKAVQVRVELSRLVAKGLLRRLGDGTKGSPYQYVNP